jgi:hypothetical protein
MLFGNKRRLYSRLRGNDLSNDTISSDSVIPAKAGIQAVSGPAGSLQKIRLQAPASFKTLRTRLFL